IARQAQVGIGTLYRNFPTRSDLVEADAAGGGGAGLRALGRRLGGGGARLAACVAAAPRLRRAACGAKG
ncbi:MAG TPA: hypothetical protein VFG79_04570, partial [Solirubrobacter sp.]|nr:hypothetical protein [Solirubrobacter sp.]